MPEAPQIRKITLDLQSFVGQKVVKATTLLKDTDLSRLDGETLKDIMVFGKQFLFVFKDFAVQYHPLLFGKVWINKSNPKGALKIGLQFKNSEFNCYAGQIHFVDQPLVNAFDWSIDVMNDAWDPKKALKKLNTKAEKLISDVLIDQDIFNGLGNKGVNEALYRAKVHPGSKVGSIPENKKKEIIKDAVEFSFDYFDWEQQGTSKDDFDVYKQDFCRVHNVPIRHEEIGTNNRKCHWCDDCQQLYV